VSFTSDKGTTIAGFCQKIEGLSVTREVEKKRSGGESLYEIKLPGSLSYGEIRMEHLYTNSAVFLDWMFNGANQGGALLADIEIKVGNGSGMMVYTLRDAFPTSWRLGNLNVVNLDAISRILQMQVKVDSIPIEMLTIVYGKMEYTTGA